MLICKSSSQWGKDKPLKPISKVVFLMTNEKFEKVHADANDIAYTTITAYTVETFKLWPCL